ncbi:hypothetical protein DQ244_04230 [Blastococcus sp. TBT05-19]|uniref:hypothetical protein n=1 Tax=Blastococcus sp. TBT05-19 TaxID=2250581 RepID=UPI000DE97CC9|nr:hypothetical protein [Blastococcus sp. TBT05-19]RBY94520.1 hypothetical protein DQ244_04230 [Blastococcus sp. TBT05-19]
MVAEETQEKGRRGVAEVKTWLEATTHLSMSWDAYEFPVQCTRKRLDGELKRYDLAGKFIGEKKRPVVVEAKSYETPGHQGSAYQEFLANAYSTTAYEIAEIGDSKTEFIWVTTHPFSLNKWPNLTSRSMLKSAIEALPECLGGESIDEDLLTAVAERLWLLVRHERQNEISLTNLELMSIYQHLGRHP